MCSRIAVRVSDRKSRIAFMVRVAVATEISIQVGAVTLALLESPVLNFVGELKFCYVLHHLRAAVLHFSSAHRLEALHIESLDIREYFRTPMCAKLLHVSSMVPCPKQLESHRLGWELWVYSHRVQRKPFFLRSDLQKSVCTQGRGLVDSDPLLRTSWRCSDRGRGKSTWITSNAGAYLACPRRPRHAET